MTEIGQEIVRQNAPAISDRLLREVGYACNVRQYVDDMVEDLGRLIAKRDDLQDALGRSPQQTQLEQLQGWFVQVDQVKEKVDKIHQDYSQRCLCLGFFSPNIISSYTISRRAVEQCERVITLQNDYNNLKNLQGRGVPASCISKCLPNVVVGKSSHLDEVLNCLKDDKTGIISICGMPGVGKTVLMRCVNNEFLPPDTDKGPLDQDKEGDTLDQPGVGRVFTFVLWVDNASSDVKTVQDKIAQRLGLGDLGPLDEDKEGDAERRASSIFSFLKNTSFLVLLDNVTSPVLLASIGIPNPIHHRCAQKQKVVLTTPFKDVSGKMGCNHMIDVQCLDPDDSRKIFASFISEVQIKKNATAAEQIIEECGGLPIALITIGGLMATNSEPQDWSRMVQHLKSSKFFSITQMQAAEDLQKSYHRLSDKHKACFLCCCLWTRGRCINKKELIDCWTGLGLIHDLSPDATVVNGLLIISHLQDCYLLLPGDNADEQVKLQPIVRDMALWIACDCGRNNKWMVGDGVNLSAQKSVIELCTIAAEAERVSLMYSEIEEVVQSVRSSSRCPTLTVLMLQHNERFTTISGSFLRSAPALKYLDLSHTKIEELPDELGTLLELQFLNLSSTKIKALPAGLRNLVKLKHLLLKHTSHLSFIPPDIFPNLPSLQVVDMYPSRYMDWEENDITSVDSKEEIGRLEQLGRRTSFIWSLGITVNAFSMVKMLGRMVKVCTTRLLLTNFRSTSSVTLSPTGFRKLMGKYSLLETLLELSIAECDTLEQVVLDGEEEEGKCNERWCLKKLQSLELRGLINLKDIVWTRMSTTFFLQALECIKMESCDKISNVSWVVYLHSLKHLELRNCAELCTVISDHEFHEPQDGNKLTTLVLVNLPKLRSICSSQVRFPSLKLIEVADCVNLTRICIKGRLGTNLPRIQGEPDWLGRLKRE